MTAPDCLTLADRFWDKVLRLGDEECWIWSGGRSSAGYGTLWRSDGGSAYRAHRISYELNIGPIPPGMVVDHTCHSLDAECLGGTTCPHRACVNPSHLELVTSVVNTRRGRAGGPPGRAAETARRACWRGHPFTNKTRTRRGCAVCLAERAEQAQVRAEARRRRSCAVDGCDRNSERAGLCTMHYKRRNRTGSFDAPSSRKIPASVRLPQMYTVGPPDACWLWLGRPDTTGYGRFRLDNGIATTAHRAVYEAHVGPIPSNLTLDHLCRVRLCVNPAHLEPVTQAVNNARVPKIPAKVCQNGHPLTADNVVFRGNTRRRTCRTCERARGQRQKAKEKAERWARLGWA
jgi:hypothetical protein